MKLTIASIGGSVHKRSTRVHLLHDVISIVSHKSKNNRARRWVWILACIFQATCSTELSAEDEESRKQANEVSLPREVAGAEAVERDEFSWSTEIDFSKDSDEKDTAFTMEGAYGLADRWELVIELPFEVVSPRKRPTTAGWGDVVLATHYGLPDNWTKGFYVEAGLGAALPTGNFKRGLGDGRVSLEPEVTVSRWLSVINIEGSIKWKRAISSGGDDPDNEFEYNLSLTYPIRDWAIVVEGGREVTFEETKYVVKPEIVWSPTEQLEFRVATPIGLNKAADDYGVIVGMTIQFEHLFHRSTSRK